MPIMDMKDIDKILEKVGITPEGIHCLICKKPITKEDIGALSNVSGKVEPVCSEFSCVMTANIEAIIYKEHPGRFA